MHLDVSRVTPGNILFWSFYDPLGTGGFEKQALWTLASLRDQGYRIACLSTTAEDPVKAARDLRELDLFDLGVEVLKQPQPTYGLRTKCKFWLSARPTEILAEQTPEFSTLVSNSIRRFTVEHHIDWIYSLALRSLYFVPGELPTPILADMVDSYTLKYRRAVRFALRRRMTALPRAIATYVKTRRIERDCIRRFESNADFVFVSPADSAAFMSLGGHPRVHDYPNQVQVKCSKVSFESENRQVNGSPTLVFYGHLYTEFNIDALLTLVDEVMPYIRRKEPSARLMVTGIGIPDSVLRLAHGRPWLEIQPTTPDIGDFVSKATVTCWPFRYGSGLNTKIVESMLFGKAVVTTPRGAEPFTQSQREAMVIGSNSHELANAVVELIRNQERRQRFEQAGREMAVRGFTIDLKTSALAKNMEDRLKARRADLCYVATHEIIGCKRRLV